MIDPERYAALGEALETCPACGYRCPGSYHYCPACGAAMVGASTPLPGAGERSTGGRRARGVLLALGFLLGAIVGALLL